jgi:3-deoxy-7-phosphoheptulonate synthase
MVIIMKHDATVEQIETIIDRLHSMGFNVHKSTGMDHTVLGAIGDASIVDIRDMQVLPGVADAHRISVPYKLVSREFQNKDTVVSLKNLDIGKDEIVVIAGPCSVESSDQMTEIAERVSKAGARLLRGGAFKPRTSPYAFQGLGEKGLRIIRDAADKYNMLVITEVMDREQIPMVSEYTDIIQVGARNMQNFTFIKALGVVDKTVFLKRGIAATIEEWLMSAEYILSGGNRNVILCERGIRTFETYTRNTLDLSAVPIVQKLSHLPVFADPSHGTGRRDKVIPMARAAVAAGADGIMIEVHNNPDKALSDGAQALFPDQFEDLMQQIYIIAGAIGRTISKPQNK